MSRNIPIGIAAISRWLSVSDTAGNRPAQYPAGSPKGCQRPRGLRFLRRNKLIACLPRRASIDNKESTMSELDWKPFLESFNQDLLADAELRTSIPASAIDAQWLGFNPATDEAINEQERRLGVELPVSYKEFLKVTNGWRYTGQFINEVFPVSEIRRFDKENQSWIDAFSSPPPAHFAEMFERFNVDMATPTASDDEYFVYGRDQLSARYEYLQNAIQVSAIGDAAVYLLCPDGVSGELEYEAWFFASWIPGARRFASFKDMMLDASSSFIQL